MPISSSYCTGCGMSSGYWLHLTQSQNPSCQAILEDKLIGVCSDSDDLPSNDICLTPVDYSDDEAGQSGDCGI